MNEQFNQLCEQAFAPCRLFYAEQDKIRDQHLADRQKVISKAGQLVASIADQQDIDYKNLDGQLNSLQHQWKNTGEVDRNQYKKLQQQFKVAIEPIRVAIQAFHQANTEEKQALIVKAEALLVNDDVYNAIESVKALQQAWRNVGFAGNHQETQLWQKFRQVNDQLFEKRKLIKTEQQAALSNQQDAFVAQLVVIETALTDLTDNDKQALSVVKQDAEALLKQVIANKPVIKSVAVRIESIIKNVDQSIDKATKAKAQQSWVSLFELMSQQATHNDDVETVKAATEFTHLTSFWQKRFLDYAKLSGQVEGHKRFDKTLAIEILGQSESPADLAGQRMKVQVQLMQEQMLSGNSIDLSKLLTQWLMLGKLSEDDLPLVERLKAIYCQ